MHEHAVSSRSRLGGRVEQCRGELRRCAPEIGGDHPRVATDLVGRRRARSPPRTRARRPGRRCPSTRPMSWSMSNIDCPASTSRRSRRPSSSLSCVSRPAAGSSRQTRRGFAASARATPTSLRWPWDSSSGRASTSPWRPSSESAAEICVGRRRVGARRPPLSVPQTDGRCAATRRFSRIVRSSNSSIDCQVRARPSRARACGGSPRQLAAVELDPPRRARTKPVIASMKVVLPAPFGPIRPTSWPGAPRDRRRLTACTPPKLTETPIALRIA